MRTDPWRPIVQQLVTRLATFRRGLREARPVPCNIQRLADSGIPVLQVRLVDDARHLIFIDQQDTVADELQKFLGQ